jgi:hypothetical protein
MRRTGYALIALLWLALMALPILAVTVAVTGEVRIGAANGGNARLFLVNSEPTHGLGLAWSRSVAGAGRCYRTNVVYLLWEGAEQGQNTSFCQCFEEGNAYPSAGGCPEP